MKTEINYQIELSHDDFILLLDVLRRSKESGIVNWDINAVICEHTKVIETAKE